MCRILEHSTFWELRCQRAHPARLVRPDERRSNVRNQGHGTGSLDLTGIVLNKAVVDLGPSSHKRAHSGKTPKKELRGQRTCRAR